MAPPSNRSLRTIVISSYSSNPIIRQLAEQLRRQNEETRATATNADQHLSSLTFAEYDGRPTAAEEFLEPAKIATNRSEERIKEYNVETYAERTEVATATPQAVALQQQSTPQKRDSAAAFASSVPGTQQDPERPGSVKKPKLSSLAEPTTKPKGPKRNDVKLPIPTRSPIVQYDIVTEQPSQQTSQVTVMAAEQQEKHPPESEAKTAVDVKADALGAQERRRSIHIIPSTLGSNGADGLNEKTENNEVEERPVKKRHTTEKDSESKDAAAIAITTTQLEQIGSGPTEPRLVNPQDRATTATKELEQSVKVTESSQMLETAKQLKVDHRIPHQNRHGQISKDQPHIKDARKAEEDTQVMKDMQKMTREVRSLRENYRLIDKIGEGTFSRVYLAEDLKYHDYDNTQWSRIIERTECLMASRSTSQATVVPTVSADPPADMSNKTTPSTTSSEANEESCNSRRSSKLNLQKGKFYVALKCIYHISSPQRMVNELKVLKMLKGNPCITPLITSFRESGYIFFVMPYHKADDFRQFFHKLPMIDIKYYMKSLFQGLKALKDHNIIHRDIKPNNFLYNVKKRTGFLIDFGLAEVAHPSEEPRRLTSDGAILIERIKAALERQSAKGYIPLDPRPSIKANRAGTRGFRAPEVLLRSPQHTCAVDIWSAGVILLCFITATYPFFLHSEEADGLMELVQIFGKQEMERVARRYGRTFATNIYVPKARRSWQTIIDVLNKQQFKAWGEDGILALDLLEKTLALDADDRITAAEALEHPFLKEVR